MNINKKSPLLRWLVLISLIVHILYVNFYDLVFPGNTIEMVTEKYKSFLTPASFTRHIWIVIYIALLYYSIVQLLPAQREKRKYDDIALPLMISIILHIWWGVAYRMELLNLSMIALVFSLFTAYISYRIAYHAMLDEEVNKTILIPLGIYMSWLMAATISRLTIWFVFIQTNEGVFGMINLARILIVAITVVGIVLSYRYWSYIFTFVLAWFLIGVYVGHKDDESIVAIPAFFFGVLLVLWSILVIFIKKNPLMKVRNR